MWNHVSQICYPGKISVKNAVQICLQQEFVGNTKLSVLQYSGNCWNTGQKLKWKKPVINAVTLLLFGIDLRKRRSENQIKLVIPASKGELSSPS